MWSYHPHKTPVVWGYHRLQSTHQRSSVLVAFGYPHPWTSKEHITPPDPDMLVVTIFAPISCLYLVQSKFINYFVFRGLVWFKPFFFISRDIGDLVVVQPLTTMSSHTVRFMGCMSFLGHIKDTNRHCRNHCFCFLTVSTQLNFRTL